MPALINRNGHRYGRLTVIGLGDRCVTSRQVRWLCRCDCGQFTQVLAQGLSQGKTQSCGCLHRELSATAKLTHGGTGTKEFKAWCEIRSRSRNPKHAGWKYYGGRGVTICKGWLESFQNFLNDVGIAPTPLHSIDRKNNNGSYSCGHCEECLEKGWSLNCRWATWTEQAANRRDPRRKGEKYAGAN